MYECNRSAITELAENGESLKSVESGLEDLRYAINIIDSQIKQSAGINEMILQNKREIAKEQYIKLRDKQQRLLARKTELTELLITKTEEEMDGKALDLIDQMIMQLLEIDDKYMETHTSSNPSIMAFIEKLIIMKKSLIVE